VDAQVMVELRAGAVNTQRAPASLGVDQTV